MQDITSDVITLKEESTETGQHNTHTHTHTHKKKSYPCNW